MLDGWTSAEIIASRKADTLENAFIGYLEEAESAREAASGASETERDTRSIAPVLRSATEPSPPFSPNGKPPALPGWQ